VIRAQVVKTFVLDGTIDGHDPIGVVLRITGGLQPFRLVVVCANLGRGYSPEKFKANVMRILDKVDERQYVVLLLQEIDEADPAHELRLLKRWMEPGTTIVGARTREPIAVSPGLVPHRRRAVLTMAQGTDIGAPVGTGPDRFLVSCVVPIEGVRIGFGCQHPHRDLPNARVRLARRRGQKVTREELAELAAVCDLVVDGADWNDRHYPLSHPHQRELIRRGLDSIRLIDPPRR
jgi:hypothetical protein